MRLVKIGKAIYVAKRESYVEASKLLDISTQSV